VKKIFLIVVILAVVIFVAYEALILYDNNFRYGRMWETHGVRPLEWPAPAMPEGAVPVEGADALLKLTPPELILPPPGIHDPEVVRLGKKLYFTYCAQCHGENLDGNGTVGQSFHPPIPDLRSATVLSLTEGVLFKEISYGKPGGRQPPLATTIGLMDRWRIVAFIQSLENRK
jgi:mono/diheme cytochrome c family protein